MTTRTADPLWRGERLECSLMTMITSNILCVVINQYTMATTPAIVATELCLVMLTSVVVTTTVVFLHLQMDRTNVLATERDTLM